MNLILENDNLIDMTELEARNQEYLNYMDKHIHGVIDAFNKYFIPLLNDNTITVGDYSNEDFINAIKKKSESIDNHDLSKYNDLEWYPYRRHFYPTTTELAEDEDKQKIAEEDYEKAWQHHYEQNPHHI